MTTATTKVADALIDQAANLQDVAPLRDEERREHDRHPYHQNITLTLLTPEGKASAPVQVQAIDISKGGLCVESRTMFREGAIGVADLPRSDGRTSLVGVQVCHCRYVGEMLHRSGLRFVPLPQREAKSQG